MYGRQGCICLQHRPYLILAVDAAVDPDVFPAALTAEQVEVITAMTGPQQGLRSLPGSYTQGVELYRHSFLFFRRSAAFSPGTLSGWSSNGSFLMRSCMPCSS
ncbi:hypothetical protein ACFTAO_17090 [Paenibacillus rhizoplanae]